MKGFVALWTILAVSVAFDQSCDWQTVRGCKCFVKRRTYESDESLTCCCFGQQVKNIPRNLTSGVQILIMKNVGIEKILAQDLANYRNLTIIDIDVAPALTVVNAEAFDSLSLLKKISITHCRKFSTVQGTLLQHNHAMLALSLKWNALAAVPEMSMKKSKQDMLFKIDLSYNQIAKIVQGDIRRVRTILLDLSNNQLRSISGFAFRKCKISKLRLGHNPVLTDIDENAFAKMGVLQELELSRTAITRLPTEGLNRLEKLVVRNTKSLKKLPSIFAFENLKEAFLTYPYHCCHFKHASRQMDAIKPNMVKSKKLAANIAEMRKKYCVKSTTAASTTPVYTTPDLNEILPPPRAKRAPQGFGSWGTWGGKKVTKTPNQSQVAPPTAKPFDDAEWFHTPVPSEKLAVPQVSTTVCETGNRGVYEYFRNITCTPQPDALNPCEDVMGYPFLRVIIWIVWICAIIGNLAVIVVLSVVHHPRMRVHYFLMMNLAFADLCIGFYLAMLAIEDINTAGEYYNYAVEWQTGMGCKIAGFICVFASQLSIIIMYLISFEIWYNTKYIFYGKRLTLRVAMLSTLGGWLICLLLALLPLVGVSSYSVTSTCLPLEIENPGDQVYLILGLTLNVAAFIGITVNYVSIYISVNGSSSPSTRPEDVQVAKKMALLIGTDFICWAPTIFFGMTAAVNAPLISITVAKVFLVLFYPINSFTNPFLYVFFTKMIRTDISRMARKHPWIQRILPRPKRYGFRHLNEETPITDRDRYYHYYHSQAPGADASPNVNNLPIVLQSTTQSTSLNSTPRNSTSNPRSSVESVNAILNEIPCPPQPPRKSFPGLKGKFQNKLSDISEHSHSSNSNEDDSHSRPVSVHDPLVQKSLASSHLSTVPEERKSTPIRKRRQSSLGSNYRDVFYADDRRPSSGSRSSGFSDANEDEASNTLPRIRPNKVSLRTHPDQMSFESGYISSITSTPELSCVNKEFFDALPLVEMNGGRGLETDDDWQGSSL